MRKTASADRLHISFFGRCNVGKSTLVNALAAQEVSLVSAEAGTTSDPVRKSMELLPLGPVMLTDTAGLDEGGGLGSARGRRSLDVLRRTDLAVLVLDETGLQAEDKDFLARCRKLQTEVLTLLNQGSEAGKAADASKAEFPEPLLKINAGRAEDIERLKDVLIEHLQEQKPSPELLDGLIAKGDLILFVTPIDAGAPKGRLILPQVRALRNALDEHAVSLTVQPEELEAAFGLLNEAPRIVVCDSQVFSKVNAVLPDEQALTSYSILFARLKGILEPSVRGAAAAASLKDGAKVLIAEGCTHHRQCEDIGTVKLPAWLENFSGAKPDYTFVSGGDFPSDLEGYDLIVHCGACMLNAKEVSWRCRQAQAAGIPFTNYGILIAHMNGILERSIEPFGLQAES